MAAAYRFVWSLLNSRKDCPFDAIQEVKPAPPSDAEVEFKRTFKGFAFVTFSSKEFVKQLVDNWPWLPANRSVDLSNGIPAPTSSDVVDAQKYGVRAITKARWEELRDEYLAYRMQLLNVIHEEGRKFGTNLRPTGTIESDLPPSGSDGLLDSAGSPDYPRGCLILAKNVHTGTNKTTLRKLFSSTVGVPQEVIDYVDFNKGMDSVRSNRRSATFIDSRAFRRSVSCVSEAQEKL